jgi:hypothetical protein
MDNCTTVFETLKGFLPKNLLERAIDETNTDHGTKKFTALRQFNTLLYAQLTGKESLRDIVKGIEADKNLQQHTGTISYSQLCRKNSDREPEIFKRMFEVALAELKKHHGIRNIPGSWGILKALDATLIRLCISLFPWANYRSTKAAIKVHVLYDILVGYPENIVVTEGIIHDKDKMASFVTKPGITYIFERGYNDYKEYDRYCKEGIFFITRLKRNAVIEIISENTMLKGSSVLCDREVILGGFYTKMQHPLRIVEVTDSSTGESFYIATNRFDLCAEEIAEIYRLRWQIELFFKWIKQHLKIKHFYGTSFNAVLNQIYTALTLFCLLKLMHILVGTNNNFLDLMRLIAGGLWNSIAYLKETLSPVKPPGPKRKRFKWEKEYVAFYIRYMFGKVSL